MFPSHDVSNKDKEKISTKRSASEQSHDSKTNDPKQKQERIRAEREKKKKNSYHGRAIWRLNFIRNSYEGGGGRRDNRS